MPSAVKKLSRIPRLCTTSGSHTQPEAETAKKCGAVRLLVQKTWPLQTRLSAKSAWRETSREEARGFARLSVILERHEKGAGDNTSRIDVYSGYNRHKLKLKPFWIELCN